MLTSRCGSRLGRRRTERRNTGPINRSWGGFIAKEIPGPGSYDQWRASFRAYRTALLMLDILTMATCVAYEAHIEKLDRLYPGAWHLIVGADDLARSEHLIRLRVSVNLDIASGTQGSDQGETEENPWEALFRILVKDGTFWSEQVHVPANAWLAHGSKGKPLTPSEAVAASTSTIQGETLPNQSSRNSPTSSVVHRYL